jgi:prepilin-type N-terminal cleavage/methylation domain-containing protein
VDGLLLKDAVFCCGPTLYNGIDMNQGFSLTEVLVSLFLISSTSLVLLKQQWQVSHLFNQTKIRSQILFQIDNTTEELLAGNVHFNVPAPMEVTQKKRTKYVFLKIKWRHQSTMSRSVVIH